MSRGLPWCFCSIFRFIYCVLFLEFVVDSHSQAYFVVTFFCAVATNFHFNIFLSLSDPQIAKSSLRMSLAPIVTGMRYNLLIFTLLLPLFLLSQFRLSLLWGNNSSSAATRKSLVRYTRHGPTDCLFSRILDWWVSSVGGVQ